MERQESGTAAFCVYIYTMKNGFLFVFAITFLLLYGCHNKSTGSNNTIAEDSARFFPVEDYFFQQAEMADSNATSMYKLSVINGIKDSVIISWPQFMELAKHFTSISISDSVNKKYYTESSFLDLSTNSFTFNYSGKNATLPIQDITILVDTATMQVKRVFINKTIITGDSTVDEKLGWKNNTSFSINRIISQPGKPDRIELITVGWNTK